MKPGNRSHYTGWMMQEVYKSTKPPIGWLSVMILKYYLL